MDKEKCAMLTIGFSIVFFILGCMTGSGLIKEEVYRNRFVIYKDGAIVYKHIDIDNINKSIQ